MQFKLARAMAKKRFDGLSEMIDGCAGAWERCIGALAAKYLGEATRRAA
jgi:hypothetical protein